MNPSWRRFAARLLKDANTGPKRRPAPYEARPKVVKPKPTIPTPEPIEPIASNPVPKWSYRLSPIFRLLGRRRIPRILRPRGLRKLRRLVLKAPQLFIWLHLSIYVFGTMKSTSGPSMLPLLPFKNSAVWISRKHRRGRGIQVGDVVSFAHPIGDYNAIKRVVGMPGDFVLRDTPDQGDGMMIQVPRGHCYLVGDNLPWSKDSRMIGPVPLAAIQGKVTLKLWPLSDIGPIHNGLVSV